MKKALSKANRILQLPVWNSIGPLKTTRTGFCGLHSSHFETQHWQMSWSDYDCFLCTVTASVSLLSGDDVLILCQLPTSYLWPKMALHTGAKRGSSDQPGLRPGMLSPSALAVSSASSASSESTFLKKATLCTDTGQCTVSSTQGGPSAIWG